jgi:hypothetical protein
VFAAPSHVSSETLRLMSLKYPDWSIHRGGSVFLDGTEDITIEDVLIDHAGGNGIFLSNHAWRTNLSGLTIAHPGESDRPPSR